MVGRIRHLESLKITAQELRKLDTSLNATYQKVRRRKDILSGNDLSSLL